MMYGFGDSETPITETVNIMEEIVHEFVTEMVNEWLRTMHNVSWRWEVFLFFPDMNSATISTVFQTL